MASSAEIVRAAREAAGLTQAALAARVGTTQSAIARLETGATQPTLARVEMLVRSCGGRLVVELDAPTPAAGARLRRAPETHRSDRAGAGDQSDRYQQRWDDAVRMANFVLDGRRALRRSS